MTGSFSVRKPAPRVGRSLERLVHGYCAQNDYEPAVSYARSRLRLDPLQEEAHCQLMQLTMHEQLISHPLTPDRWPDFEVLFGPRGAYGGCWCMWWRVTRSQFEKQQGDGNRKAMREIVNSGEVPGIIAYADGEPVAWCSVAPRESFGSLNRSPVLKRLDDKPVWSIVCFYVAKGHRGEGLIEELIRGAIEHVRGQGGKIVEAYPIQPRAGQLPPVSSFMGIPSVFEKVGFVECARPSKSKIIMRYYIDS